MFEAKRVLLITRKVQFSTNATTALEPRGYKITAFTNSRPAIDYLRENPQDIAVLDFRVNDMPAPDTIDHMRAILPNIILIAAPNHPAVHDLKDKHNLKAIINIPYPLKRFVSILETALTQSSSDASSKTTKPPSSGRATENATIEFWVALDDEDDSKKVTPPKPAFPGEQSTKLFNKLAAEEPPMPKLSEGSTVRDLRDFLTDSDNIRKVLEVFSDDSTAKNALQDEPVQTNEDSRSIPAAVFLDVTMGDSTPIDRFSVDEFMTRAKESGVQILVPPSWIEADEKDVREPEFLKDNLPRIQDTYEYTITKTTPNEAQSQQVEEDPGNLVTDQIEPVSRSRPPQSLPETPQDTSANKPPKPPMDTKDGSDKEDTEQVKPTRDVPLPPSLPEMPPEPIAEPMGEEEAKEHTADFELIKSDTQRGEPTQPQSEPQSITESGVPFSDYDRANPYVAQLALKLTLTSLETTAEASILLEDGELVAFAGNLPREDIEEIRETLNERGLSKATKTQIGFLNLRASATDYMLFTCPTDSDHTLVMVFTGITPVHVIREQGQRLAEALAAVPQVEPEPEVSVEEEATQALRVPTDEEIGERAPFTFVWMLRDSTAPMQAEVAEILVKGLDKQLIQTGWKLHDLDVRQDYVYIYGDMPTMLEARQTIHDLMKSSAELLADKFIKVDVDSLWDDSYLVLQPGREMNADEIEMFLDFNRE